LIAAIGLKKAPKGTIRGVFVVDKAGKVLAAKQGSPDGTVEVVTKLVAAAEPVEPEPAKEEEAKPVAATE
jgi:thioredoxin-dependent peroxiredoxin